MYACCIVSIVFTTRDKQENNVDLCIRIIIVTEKKLANWDIIDLHVNLSLKIRDQLHLYLTKLVYNYVTTNRNYSFLGIR